MFTISLIAPPDQLEPSLVQALQSAWGALDDAVWLSPDEAAEFPVATCPDDLEQVRLEIRNWHTDVNCLPADGRRKRLLIADMDSTMIQQECIDELADVAGAGSQVAAITARAMNGQLDFEAALRERVALLAGLDAGIIDSVFRDRITMMPGGETLVRTMRANGAYAALVSGGFTPFTERVAATLGFDEHRANELVVADGRLTGEVAEPILGRDAKVAALEDICARLGIVEADAIAVGDGANDLGMLARAGAGVALHAKPTVAAAAKIQIDNGDLTSLLFLQGYSRDDFV